jgi:hypothetical protein
MSSSTTGNGEDEEFVTLSNDDVRLDNQKHTFNIKCANNDEYVLVGRPCELSAFSFVPTRRDFETADRNIYNFKREESKLSSNSVQNYDRLFKVEYDFNNKVHRDDRKNAKQYGLKVWNEEITKETPTRSSSQYGKRQLDVVDYVKPVVNFVSKLDPPNRKHARVAKVQSDFFNRNGINDLNRQRNVL